MLLCDSANRVSRIIIQVREEPLKVQTCAALRDDSPYLHAV